MPEPLEGEEGWAPEGEEGWAPESEGLVTAAGRQAAAGGVVPVL